METSKPIHCFTNDILADHDGVALAALIRRGELSVQEVEAAAIARIRQVEPQLKAVAYPAYDRPRRSGDPSRLLYGVPTLIKDNVDVLGMPSNHGSEAFVAPPAPKDDPYTLQYVSTGMTVLGKSRMPEFGFNATTEFRTGEPVCNPWNRAYSCGASSGGAAALVAAGAIPIAHANDGGGSIRIPAAATGLVGLKPSRGRHIDTNSSRSLPINIISEGVVTRTVRDTAAFFAATEQYWRNPKLAPIGLVEGPARRKLRIGLIMDSVNGVATDAPTRAAVEKTARLLEAEGHSVEPIPMPVDEQFAEDFTLYWALLASLTANFGRLLFGPSFEPGRLDGLTQGLRRHFRRDWYRIAGAMWRLRRISNVCARVFDRHELILSPVLTHTTPLLGHLSPNVDYNELIARLSAYVGFTPLNNIAGTPAISLPMGMTDSGLPIGVQLSAAYGDERTLIETAFALEAAAPWPLIHTSGHRAANVGGEVTLVQP